MVLREVLIKLQKQISKLILWVFGAMSKKWWMDVNFILINGFYLRRGGLFV